MKTTEHYIALLAAMFFVAMQHKEKPWAARTGIAGASGGLGYAIAPEAANMAMWLGEVTAMVAITALIYGLLDTVAAIVADREAVKSIVAKSLGKGGK